MTEKREMTALDALVGAGAEQSHDLTPTIIPDYGENFNPSAEEIFLAQQEYEQEMQVQAQAECEAAPDFMQTVSMPELYEMVYPGKPPIIDHFLYPGTYLFVGAPKVGKSFMMAQIAYHVSSGTPMWNYAVRKGTVLYLALEDDYRRLQERLYRMFGTEVADDLFFSVASKSLNEGLLDQLGTFMNKHPETSLVIIDTLQKVREAEGDTYSYARDYDIIAGLKAFADRTGICLILVHHTRKQKSDDSFDRISGTNGLLGAADGAFIMYKNKRSDGDATIEVSGRDQPDKKYMLSRNKETLCWELSGEKSPEYTEPTEPVLEAIGNFINVNNPTWTGTATELIEKLELDIKPNALSLKLNVNAGKLYNLYFVKYSNKRTHKAKLIQLRYDTKHPIVVTPNPTEEETPAEQKGVENAPAVTSEIIISTDTVNDIAGEDYDQACQEMIDNALA